MHGFRDSEVLLQAGYDVIVISPLGGASGNFHDGSWISENDFLIVFHSNFSSVIHGFRDNNGFIASWIWRHGDFSAKGRFRRIFMTDSERATNIERCLPSYVLWSKITPTHYVKYYINIMKMRYTTSLHLRSRNN